MSGPRHIPIRPVRPSNEASVSEDATVTVYEHVGAEFFVDLVERFYEGVVAEPLLRPLYPADLTESKRDLAEFLTQYWGGPTTYSDRKGNPRLRMRRRPFAIGRAQHDAWLRCMRAAVAAVDADPAVVDRLDDYFTMAAGALINTEETSNGGRR